MKLGDLVKVETKHYGVKFGFLSEKVVDSYGEGWMVTPTNHPRQIYSDSQDIEVISESR
tara:strand:+ start:3492 stop:3668 length:177 start_codon:yes stop_codon:yes gene_type:complete